MKKTVIKTIAVIAAVSLVVCFFTLYRFYTCKVAFDHLEKRYSDTIDLNEISVLEFKGYVHLDDMPFMIGSYRGIQFIVYVNDPSDTLSENYFESEYERRILANYPCSDIEDIKITIGTHNYRDFDDLNARFDLDVSFKVDSFPSEELPQKVSDVITAINAAGLTKCSSIDAHITINGEMVPLPRIRPNASDSMERLAEMIAENSRTIDTPEPEPVPQPDSKPMPEPEPQGELLSADELSVFEALFDRGSESHAFAPMLLTSEYAAPEDINIGWLFREGIPVEEGEQRWLSWDEKQEYAYLGIGLEGDWTLVPAAAMDALLQKHLGLTLEETNKEGLHMLTYVEAEDTYIGIAWDTNLVLPRLNEGRRLPDGSVELYYHDALGTGPWPDEDGNFPLSPATHVMKLVPAPEGQWGGWHIFSNLKLE